MPEAGRPRLGQNRHFRAKAKFFGQKPTAKNEKYFFLYLLNDNTEFVASEINLVPEIRDFY